MLRELAPQVLATLVKRYGDFAAAEDALQEAMLSALTKWPKEGTPDNPAAWLTRVASRRMTDQYRNNEARYRREVLAASWTVANPTVVVGTDDTLRVMFMCCHETLSPNLAIPLVLRAVGGLTTREIASAFVVPEATIAQRISRAKAKIKETGARFDLDDSDARQRLPLVLHILYLMFNEGHVTTASRELMRVDLVREAIRLTRSVHRARPDDGEIAGLLALMLFTDARRAARTGDYGELVPLSEQDRTLWDRALIAEADELIDSAIAQGTVGEYQLQAAIAAIHDQAATYEQTDWSEIAMLYEHLERITENPMVSINRAVAMAMTDGPEAGLRLLESLDDTLKDHHRLHSVRGHLYEMAGASVEALREFEIAVNGTANQRERDYLLLKISAITLAGW